MPIREEFELMLRKTFMKHFIAIKEVGLGNSAVVSEYDFGPEVLGFEPRQGLGIFSALKELKVQCYISISPLLRQVQPAPAGFPATQTTMMLQVFLLS